MLKFLSYIGIHIYSLLAQFVVLLFYLNVLPQTKDFTHKLKKKKTL